MENEITSSSKISELAKVKKLTLILLIHGIIGLCVIILFYLPPILRHLSFLWLNPPFVTWLAVILSLSPILCIISSVLLHTLRQNTVIISSLAIYSILIFWLIVSLPVTGFLIFLCIYQLDGSWEGPHNAHLAEISFYIGHLIFWIVIWYFSTGKNLHWLLSQNAKELFSSKNVNIRWNAVRYPILFITLLIIITSFFTIRNYYINSTKVAGLNNDATYLQKVWSVPDIFLPQKIKEDVIINYFTEKNKPEDIQWFLDHGFLPNTKDKMGDTALHNASGFANVEIVKLLISRGADVNCQNDNKETPIHYLAICSSRGEDTGRKLPQRLLILKLLVNAHANLDVKDENKMTAIQVSRNPQFISALLNNGVDPADFRKIVNSDWYLPSSAQEGNLDLVKIALKYGANINTHNHSDNNETALHYAIQYSHIDVIRYLIKQGADINNKNGTGQTPIDYAHKTGRKDIIAIVR